MTTVVELFIADHRQCDSCFAEFEAAVARQAWEAAGQLWTTLHSRLQRHFAVEEETLFPALERQVGQALGPVMVMRSEHQQMRGLLQELEAAYGRRDVRALLGGLETLMIVMQQHNMKEENILYPMADDILGAEGGALVAHMKKLLEEA